MIRHGRTRPFLEREIGRVPCVRCGKRAKYQWNACADGFWRAVCLDCDIQLNELVLVFMRDPDVKTKMQNYRIKMEK